LRGVTVCPNYLIADDAIALSERDFYTSRELLQMRPVAGGAMYQHMLAVNGWWQNYLPNAAPLQAPNDHTSWWQRAAEALLAPIAGRLERGIYGRKVAELRGQGAGSEVVFDERMCKGHFDGHRRRTEEALRQRLQLLGVDAP